MTVITVAGVVLLAIILSCVVVLYRRGRGAGSAHAHTRSAAELDAQARSASARAGDHQGTGPF